MARLLLPLVSRDWAAWRYMAVHGDRYKARQGKTRQDKAVHGRQVKARTEETQEVWYGKCSALHRLWHTSVGP
jgi:hypothetical protein